jgi:hypothetical protein
VARTWSGTTRISPGVSILPQLKHYKVAADNLFNSKSTTDEFTKNLGVHVYGTIRANKGMPDEMREEKQQGGSKSGKRRLQDKGAWFFQVDPSDNTVAYCWRDSGVTTFISDSHGLREGSVLRRVPGRAGRTQIKCPQVAVDYNKDVTAVDDFDRLVALHSVCLRSSKW